MEKNLKSELEFADNTCYTVYDFYVAREENIYDGSKQKASEADKAGMFKSNGTSDWYVLENQILRPWAEPNELKPNTPVDNVIVTLLRQLVREEIENYFGKLGEKSIPNYPNYPGVIPSNPWKYPHIIY